MPNRQRRARNKPTSLNQNMSHTIRAAPPQDGSQGHQAMVYGEEAGLMMEVQIMAEDIVTKLTRARAKNSITDLPPSERTRGVFGSVRDRIITALRNALNLLEDPHDSPHGSAASIPAATYSHHSNSPPYEYPPQYAEVPHVHYHTHNLGMPYMPTIPQGSYHVLIEQNAHPSYYPYQYPYQHPYQYPYQHPYQYQYQHPYQYQYPYPYQYPSPRVPYGPPPQPNPYPQCRHPAQSPSRAHAHHAGQHDSQFPVPAQDASVQAGVPQGQGN